jgi:hypothetical protein
MCDALVDLVDAGAAAGTLEFQTGAGAEVATCTLNDPAFGAAAAGVATMGVAPAVTDASATGGTTTKALFKDSNGTEVFRCTVSTVGADINLTNNVIVAGETVTVTSLTVTVPAS